MIRTYRCTFGQRQPGQLYTCRTEVLIEYLGIRHWKNFSHERNQRSTISKYLVAQYMYMFPRKRDRSWNRQERRGYLLVTMNHRKHIASTFLLLGKLRLAEMLLSMRIQPSANRSKIIQMRSVMRSLKLLE